MTSSADAATWRAVSTLEWKQKQRRPAAGGSKGFGAILGEAADLAGKGAGGSGAGGSYLHARMSEIQVQDESYIHQQLVRPDEVKPKHASQRLPLSKAGRLGSGRGVRVGSSSRKVRFEGEGSSHKAASPKAQRSSGSGSSSGALSADALGHTQPATTAAAASSPIRGGHASSTQSCSGVKFSNLDTTSRGQEAPDPQPAATSAAARLSKERQAQPAAADHGPAACSTSAGTLAGHAPACALPRGAGSSCGAGVAQSQPSPASSSPLTARFRQPQQQLQPEGAPLQADPGAHTAGWAIDPVSSGGRAGSLDRHVLQAGTDWAGSPHASAAGAAAAVASRAARGSTELVDKQLQWLRDTSAAHHSSGAGSSEPGPSGTPAAVAGAISSGSGSSSVGAGSSSGPSADYMVSLGYRPHAIPEQLFDRWTAAGKPAVAAGAASAPAPAIDTNGGSCRPASHTRLMGAAVGAATAPLVPSSSTPGSACASKGAGPVRARRLSATNAGEPGCVTSALHRVPRKQATADGLTLSSIAASLRLPAAGTPAASGSRRTTQLSSSQQTPACSHPGSGAASPTHAPGSPKGALAGPQGHRRSGSSLAACAPTSLSPMAAGGVVVAAAGAGAAGVGASCSGNLQPPCTDERSARTSSCAADEGRAGSPFRARSAAGMASAAASSDASKRAGQPRRASSRMLPAEQVAVEVSGSSSTGGRLQHSKGGTRGAAGAAPTRLVLPSIAGTKQEPGRLQQQQGQQHARSRGI